MELYSNPSHTTQWEWEVVNMYSCVDQDISINS